MNFRMTNPRNNRGRCFLNQSCSESYMSDIISFYAPSRQGLRNSKKNSPNTCLERLADLIVETRIKYKYEGKNLSNKIQELLRSYEDPQLTSQNCLCNVEAIRKCEDLLAKSKECFRREYRNHSKRQSIPEKKSVRLRKEIKSCGQQTGESHSENLKKSASNVNSMSHEGQSRKNSVLCRRNFDKRKIFTDTHTNSYCEKMALNSPSSCKDTRKAVSGPRPVSNKFHSEKILKTKCSLDTIERVSNFTAEVFCSEAKNASCNVCVWETLSSSLSVCASASCVKPCKKKIIKPFKLSCDSRCQLLKSNLEKIHKGQEVFPFSSCQKTFRVVKHPLLVRKPPKYNTCTPVSTKRPKVDTEKHKKKNIFINKNRENVIVLANTVVVP